MDPFGSTEINGNTATTQYVKQYSSRWELQIEEIFPYPMTDSYSSTITFEGSNNKPDSVDSSGTLTLMNVRKRGDFTAMAMLPGKYSGKAQVEYGSKTVINVEMETFVAMPKVSGHGFDDYGKFSLSSSYKSSLHETVTGSYLTVAYTKTYSSGELKGQSLKFKENLAWPITGVITAGRHRVTNLNTGVKYRGSHALGGKDTSGLVTSETNRYFKLDMGGSWFTFAENNFIRLPAISGSGSVEGAANGAYTVSGATYAGGSPGTSTQTFTFSWG